MKLDELSQPLDELQAKELKRAQEENSDNKEIVILIQRVREAYLHISSSRDVIWEINKRQKEIDKDRYKKKSPYYYILLAYAYYRVGQTDEAEKCAETAESQFKCQGKYWHQSICNWFLGLLLYKLGQLNRSKTIIERAIEIVTNLDEGQYLLGLFPSEYKYLKKAIEESYSQSENRAREVFKNTPQMVSPEEFLKIIHRLRIPDEVPELCEWWEAACDLDPFNISDISTQIAILNNMLLLKIEDMPIEMSFAHIFLAHFYNIQSYSSGNQNQEFAIQCLSDSIKEFQDYPNELNTLNHALSCWYLGLLYCNILDTKTGLSYLDASYHLLDGLLREYQYGDIDVEYIQNLQNDIGIWISKLGSMNRQEHLPTLKSHEVQRSQYGVIDKVKRIVSKKAPANPISSSGSKQSDLSSKSPSAPETTKYSSDFLNDEVLRLHSNSQYGRGQKIQRKYVSQRENPQAMHIIIPVDMRALEDPCLDATPLELSLFEQLREYHEHKANLQPNPKRSTVPGDNVASLGAILPRLPIYGYAAARPDGEVSFQDTLGYASVVDENFHVKFGDHEYVYRSTKRNDLLITYKENIIGWLKIEGDSMTGAWPIPIEEQDYVLFNKNRDLETLANKIVIASLPDEIQPSRLVIKYLVKKSRKFFLRSASLSWDYEDIEVIRDYQIVGEVVAIAKPI